MSEAVKIADVGPRDGLQNEQQAINIGTMIGLIERLVAAGARNIEAASFVSPSWVPQMEGSVAVMLRVPRTPGAYFSALAPNLKGLEAAIEAGCEEVPVFGAASESFSKRNINCSIHERLDRFRTVVDMARRNNLRVRGYVSCVLGCPYEGPISPEKVAEVAMLLHEMGCYEISLGDTIGRGTPKTTRRMLKACMRHIPVTQLAEHHHDTYGIAIANVVSSLEV
jgi:hydroxymethylglutaryl-CoA lyase